MMPISNQTGAFRETATRLAVALSTGQPICHLVTDDFTQVVRLTEKAFFHRGSGQLDAEAYTPGAPSASYKEIKLFARDNGKDAKVPWYLKLSAEVVLYARPDGRNGFDSATLAAMLDFTEYYNLAYHRAQEALRTDAGGMLANTFALRSRLILYGSNAKVPVQLERFTERVELTPLSAEDYGLILRREDAGLTDVEIRWYADHLGGYDEWMTHRVARLILNSGNRATLRDLRRAEEIITHDKNMLMSSHNKLRCMSAESRPVRGLESVTDWLREHRDSLHGAAASTAPPRGMLLVGIPGTGKSETAKCAADILALPLVKLEMSRILGGLVGDSEHNMEQVLEDLTFLAPCVLWIDELEKAMSGANGGAGDSGVMERLFGMLLTFMQEMKRNVFIVATANDIGRLPPEFFRNGRFDVRFCLMMPDFEALTQIMQSKLEAHDIYEPSLARALTEICAGTEKHPRFLTGADIAAMVAELFALLPGEIKRKDEGLYTNLLRVMRERVVPRVVAYGDAGSLKNLDDIAGRYCDMLQRSLLMAGSGIREPIFSPERFHPERITEYIYRQGDNADQPICMDPPANADSADPYDRWLFTRITARMDRLLAQSASAEVQHDLRLKAKTEK